MNKKTVAMITSLAVGGTLLLGTAYVNASQLSGYETYKAAVMDTKNIKNGTAAVTVSVTDNGTSLVDASSTVKLNFAAKAASSVTSLKSGSTNETFNTYSQDGKNISHNSSSDVYMVMEDKHNSFDRLNKPVNPEIEKSMEVVIDTLVGSMKDGVSAVDNSDGTKDVTIKLNDSQVTPLVNAVASMVLVKGGEMPRKGGTADISNIKNSIPQLQDNIKVESVDSTAKIDKDGYVASQNANVVISGNDAEGKSHSIVMTINMNLSNINNTTPDKVDLTGKQVKTITPKFGGEYRK